MVYTVEEKQRMERLLEVFSDYVAESQNIDIAYADKTGYVRLVIAEDADWVYFPIKSFDGLLLMLIYDLIADEENRVFSQYDNCDYSMFDIDRLRENLHARLNMLEDDREYAIEKMERHLTHWEEMHEIE